MPNIIDTRDLQTRLEELESELEDLQEAVNDAEEELEECEEGEHHEPFMALNEATAELEDWQDENQEELEELRQLADEIPEWRHGETLINDDYFVEYAQDLAEDVCGMNRDQPWPYSYIDWDAAAEALQMDYSSCEYQGETYWFRG